MNADELIKKLDLQPHPEGGFFRETYRSNESIPAAALPERFNGSRDFSTAIYFLLKTGDYSAFHRIRSDEVWHFYDGDPCLVHIIDQQGSLKTVSLARGNYQYMVAAGCWFASEPEQGKKGYSLVGCTVAPGFDFADFEMAESDVLAEEFPQHEELIKRLSREP